MTSMQADNFVHPLLRLSEDALGRVAFYLSPIDVQSLYQIGCPSLWSQFRRAARVFSNECPVLPFASRTVLPLSRPFPLIHQLRRLTHIALYACSPKISNSCPLDLKSLPPTLVSFELEILGWPAPQTVHDVPPIGMMYTDAVMFLRRDLRMNWAKRCPRLETFRLFYPVQHTTAGIRVFTAAAEAFILSLPKTITTLSLIHPTVDVEYVLPFLGDSKSQVKVLPPEPLIISYESEVRVYTPVFPNLQHLELFSSSNPLPALYRAPVTLRSLKIIQDNFMSPFSPLDSIEPGLRELEVVGVNAVDPDWMASIPHTLDRITLVTSVGSHLADAIKILGPYRLKNLRKFGLGGNSTSFNAKEFPRDLEELRIPTLFDPDFTNLPRNLTCLELSHVKCSVEAFSTLPPQMLFFKAFEYQSTSALQKEKILVLPPSLRVFCLSLSPPWAIEMLTQLPASLQSFYVPMINVSRNFVQNLPPAPPPSHDTLPPPSPSLLNSLFSRLFPAAQPKVMLRKPSLEERIKHQILPPDCVFEVHMVLDPMDDEASAFLRSRLR
jgi:hypothetical protein